MALISGLTSHYGQIKGGDLHVGHPGPPAWGLGVRPTIPSKKRNYGEKISQMLGIVLINSRLCDCKERDFNIGKWNTRQEGTKWGLAEIETPSEEGQGPEGTAAPYIDGWALRTKHEVNLQNTGLCNCIYRLALVTVCNVFCFKQPAVQFVHCSNRTEHKTEQYC